MKIRRQKIILLIIFLLLAIFNLFLLIPIPLLFPGSVGGNFGLRPQSHRCLGISLNAWLVNNILPELNIGFPLPSRGFELRIDKDWSREYCLGQDIWYGE